MNPAITEIIAERDKLKAINEELLEALQAVRPWIGDGIHSDSSGIPRSAFTQAYNNIIDNVDAAIAKAYFPSGENGQDITG